MATLQWAAGFIDGEGSLDIYLTGRRQYIVRLQVVNTFLPALKALQNLFPGGRIYPKRSSYKNALPCYQITWTGKKAVEPILQALLPFSIVKREQIEFVLQSWMPRILNTKEALSTEELNTRNQIKQTLASMKRQAFLQ